MKIRVAVNMTVAAAVLIALGAGCAGTQAGPGASSAAEVSSEDLFPTLLTARAAWTGEIRAAKLRVWADDAYRAQNTQWQAGLDDQVAYANRVLMPMLGVGLTAEYRAWDNTQGEDLAAELEALVRKDPGDGVVWVVGFTGASSASSPSFEQLGVARLSHLVVRGYAESEQRRALERAFPDATVEARRRALIARGRHQTTLVLLRQLALSLGAQPESEPDGILSARYSPVARASIGEDNRQRMLGALGERLAAPGQYGEAERLLRHGDAAGAAAALAPVLRLYPAQVKPRVLRCKIELARRAQDGAAGAACDDAAATGVDSAVSVAAARRGAGDVEGAQRTLIAAEEQIASAAPAKAAAGWLALASEYREIGALTRAEDALARAGAADHGMAALIATARARYGIPRGGMRWNLTIDDEPAAAAAVRNAVSLVNADHQGAATTAIEAAERRWPALPGVLTARCALEYRRDAIAAARRSCERALAEGGSSWALHLLATMELETRRGSAAVAIARLREAIARDPDLAQAWRTLGRALEQRRATAELEQLRRDYRARFRAPLPR